MALHARGVKDAWCNFLLFGGAKILFIFGKCRKWGGGRRDKRLTEGFWRKGRYPSVTASRRHLPIWLRKMERILWP